MSTISGRITDEVGEPIEEVSVYAMCSLFYEGGRKLEPVNGGTVRTDEEGEFRLSRLPPAAYQVMARTNETWMVVQDGRETVLGYRRETVVENSRAIRATRPDQRGDGS